MRKYIVLSLIVFVGACSEMPPPGADCGAASMQPLVGKPAVDLVKFIATQPRYVQNNAYYLGDDETIGAEIPRNALIARVNTDHVGAPQDLVGKTITGLGCN